MTKELGQCRDCRAWGRRDVLDRRLSKNKGTPEVRACCHSMITSANEDDLPCKEGGAMHLADDGDDSFCGSMLATTATFGCTLFRKRA